MAIVKDKFPDDHKLQNIQLLRKWVSSPNTLVHGLRKPDLVIPIDLADKMASKPITFECHILRGQICCFHFTPQWGMYAGIRDCLVLYVKAG